MPRESTRRRSDLPSPPSTPAGANGPSPALRADVGTSFVLCWSVCRAGPEGPSPCTRFSGLRQAACHHATLHKTRAVIVCATTEVMSSPMSGRTRGTSLLRRVSRGAPRRPLERCPAPKTCTPLARSMSPIAPRGPSTPRSRPREGRSAALPSDLRAASSGGSLDAGVASPIDRSRVRCAPSTALPPHPTARRLGGTSAGRPR